MKNLILIIFFFLLFLSGRLSGQEITFEYLLSLPLNEQFSDIVEAPDGTIYFSTRINTVEQPNIKKALLVKLDIYGNFIDSAVITYPGKSIYISHIFSSDSGQFVIVASIYDTIGTRKNAGIMLSGMNDDFTMFDQTIYFFPPSYTLDGLSSNLQANGNIMVGGAVEVNNHTPRPFLYEFNNDFDSLKAKFYLDDFGVVSHIKRITDGKYWFTKDIHEQYQLVDSAFNYVSDQKIPDNLTANFGVKWDTDTSFYLLGDKVWPEPSHNLGFIRQYHPMDTTGHLFNQWGVSDTIDFPAAWNGIDFKNKDSIFIGGTRYFWLGWYNPWPSWFIVLQTDSMLNIRWERFYGGDAYFVMCNLIAAHDGGCLVAGTRYDYLHVTEQQTDIIILKLNSEGLITGNEEHPSIKMQEALVFPNPGTNKIKIRVAVQYPESMFRLFDMNGKQLLSQQIQGRFGTVNTTFLKPGTFIYRITSDDGLNESGKWVKQ